MKCVTGRLWTPAEDAAVRERYAADGAAATGAAIDRTAKAVHQRARNLGVSSKPAWSDIDKQRLRNWWGEFTVAKIARLLGRTPMAVFEYATMRAGLHSGPPLGSETIRAAEARTGFHARTLQLIAEWAGVELTRPMGAPRGGKLRRWCVDRVLLDEAIERWMASEWLAEAARDRGVGREWLSNRVVLIPEAPKKPGNGRRWRIPTELIDRAVAASGRQRGKERAA